MDTPRIDDSFFHTARSALDRFGVAARPRSLAAACRVVVTALRNGDAFEEAIEDAIGVLEIGGWSGERDGDARLVREMFYRLCVEAFAARRAQSDLERASAMQRSWSPGEQVQDFGDLAVAGCLETAGACGGDLWEARALAGGGTLLVVGDVTGSGIEAAMVVAAARGALGVACSLLRPRPLMPSDVLRVMNGAVYEVGAGHRTMTCMALIVHPDGNVVACGAGHPLPYIIRANGSLATLGARGPSLGDPMAKYQNVRERLEARDSLLLYTDGLVESRDRHDVEFGHRRLRQFLRQSHRVPVDVVRDSLYVAVMNHHRGQAKRDDMAFVFARRGARSTTIEGLGLGGRRGS